MISLELCEISLIFREIKTTTAKKFLPTCSKSQKNIIFEAVFINRVFNFKNVGL